MTTSGPAEILLAGAGETQELGRRLGRALAPATSGVLCLSGHLGAGKTTLVKGLAEGLGVAAADEVTSPTFLRVVRFDGVPPLVHVDAYRMTGPDDLFELGLDEDLAGHAVVALEWPQIVMEGLPPDRLVVHLDHLGEGARRARIEPLGAAAAAWSARLDLSGFAEAPGTDPGGDRP